MPLPRRLKFAAAQIGGKPGKEQVLSLLIEPPELPGAGWFVIDERTWRTGQTDNPSAAATRARNAGSISAWRSFEQKSHSRWLWVQITPTVSEADAQQLVRDMPNRFLKNSRAEVVVKAERTVKDRAIPGAQNVWCYEQDTTSKKGDSVAKYVAGTVGVVVFVLAASVMTDGWAWDEVIGVAATQARRLPGGFGTEKGIAT